MFRRISTDSDRPPAPGFPRHAQRLRCVRQVTIVAFTRAADPCAFENLLLRRRRDFARRLHRNSTTSSPTRPPCSNSARAHATFMTRSCRRSAVTNGLDRRSPSACYVTGEGTARRAPGSGRHRKRVRSRIERRMPAREDRSNCGRMHARRRRRAGSSEEHRARGAVRRGDVAGVDFCVTFSPTTRHLLERHGDGCWSSSAMSPNLVEEEACRPGP